MDNVTCYGQIKALTLNDNSVTAKIEIELERGLVDDLMDLKRRGQFRLVMEPFQKRLGEVAMAEIRAFAEAHPYVRVEVPASGCDHPIEARRLHEDGTFVCAECGEVLLDAGTLTTSRAEDEAADHAKADQADAEFQALAGADLGEHAGGAPAADVQFGALADSSHNNRRAPATDDEKKEQAEAAERLAHSSSP